MLDPASGLPRPVTHPPLGRDAEEAGGEAGALPGVDLVGDRAQVDDFRVAPVRREAPEIDFACPVRHGLHPAVGLVLVDERGRHLGILDHDLDVLGGKDVQVRDLHPRHLAAVDAARQDRDSGPET